MTIVLRDKSTGTFFEEIQACEVRGDDVILPWTFEVEVTGTWTVRYVAPVPLQDFVDIHTDRGSSRRRKADPIRIRPRVADPGTLWTRP